MFVLFFLHFVYYKDSLLRSIYFNLRFIFLIYVYCTRLLKWEIDNNKKYTTMTGVEFEFVRSAQVTPTPASERVTILGKLEILRSIPFELIRHRLGPLIDHITWKRVSENFNKMYCII